MRYFFILLFTAAAIFAGLQWRNRLSTVPAGVDVNPIPDHTVSSRDLAQQLTSRLTSSGWPDPAARSVVALNLDRYVWLYDTVGEKVVAQEIQGYQALRPAGRVAQLLEKYPAMGGVMLLARDPAVVAEAVLQCEDEDDRKNIIGSFVKYTDRSEISSGRQPWPATGGAFRGCCAGVRPGRWNRCSLFPPPRQPSPNLIRAGWMKYSNRRRCP